MQWIHAPAENRTLNTIFPWFFHIYNIFFFFGWFSFSQSLAILFLSSYISLQLLHQFLSALEHFLFRRCLSLRSLFCLSVQKSIWRVFANLFLSNEEKKKRNNTRQIRKTPQKTHRFSVFEVFGFVCYSCGERNKKEYFVNLQGTVAVQTIYDKLYFHCCFPIFTSNVFIDTDIDGVRSWSFDLLMWHDYVEFTHKLAYAPNVWHAQGKM